MLLQEEGGLLTSDPVGRYLPEFARTQVAVATSGGGYDVVDARERITIRQLLTHTSGVSYGTGPASDRWESAGIQGWYFADREEPVETPSLGSPRCLSTRTLGNSGSTATTLTSSER